MQKKRKGRKSLFYIYRTTFKKRLYLERSLTKTKKELRQSPIIDSIVDFVTRRAFAIVVVARRAITIIVYVVVCRAVAIVTDFVARRQREHWGGRLCCSQKIREKR
jgi:hypothetical protein